MSIPVPVALAELIKANNQLLKNYQQELTQRVINANIEMMKFLNLDPDDGWRLDIDTMTYIKVEQNASSVSE
jgi:hypothetical protein